MLRVAMLSYHTCPLATLGGKDTGGMNVYVRDLTRHLGPKGVHVDVFTRSQDEHVPHVLHDLGYGNRVVHIPAGPEIPLPKPALAEYIDDFVEGIASFTEKKGLQYDIIHSHYWMSGVAAKHLKLTWDVPVIHMFHTLGAMKNRIAQNESEREGDYRLSGEKQVLDTADRIVVATPAERSQLEFLYHADVAKMVVIPPGVDTSRFYPIAPDEAKDVIGIPPGDRMLLFVGRIEPLKGIEVLIRALSIIKQSDVLDECPHYLVVIGGEESNGPQDMTAEMERLQALCKELCLDDVVVFIGKRDQDMLPYYYSAAEMVVMPSHYESFGLVALEAMACGTPVIASQVGGLAYLVEDGVTGYVVPDGDEVALAERITMLICKPELRLPMRDNATAHAQDYAWNLVAEQILETYKEMLTS